MEYYEVFSFCTCTSCSMYPILCPADNVYGDFMFFFFMFIQSPTHVDDIDVEEQTNSSIHYLYHCKMQRHNIRPHVLIVEPRVNMTMAYLSSRQETIWELLQNASPKLFFIMLLLWWQQHCYQCAWKSHANTMFPKASTFAVHSMSVLSHKCRLCLLAVQWTDVQAGSNENINLNLSAAQFHIRCYQANGNNNWELKTNQVDCFSSYPFQ